MSSPSTVAALLRHHASAAPDAHAFRFLGSRDGDVEDVTRAGLYARSARLAARLDVAPGARVLLLHPPGIGYIVGFLGCILAGAVPVPAYPPRNNRNLERIRAILDDAGATVALSNMSMVARLSPEPELAGLRWVATDTDEPGPELEVELPGNALAFLQYTSGSTGTPKGVRVLHDNLLANLEAIAERFHLGPWARSVIWLPPFHDMGLIGGILAPIASAFPCTLMAPTTFLVRPSGWLEAISREQATVGGGPDFAWALCARRVSEEVKARLDLSSWEVAFTGAEPVRPGTLARFVETFGPCGFRPAAFVPCYGLAESTLLVSGTSALHGPTVRGFSADALTRMEVAPGDTPFVGCGAPALHTDVRIVDPETGVPLAEGVPGAADPLADSLRVGEIEVRSPGVADGYWGRPVESAATFVNGWLKTGDLGFLQGGELYVTGRKKDLVIVRGRNLYPQDLEALAEAAHPDLRANSGAAFGVEVDGEERLVIALESEPRRAPDVEAVTTAVVAALAQGFDVSLHEVVLLAAGSLPRTSSGKVRRATTRLSWIAGTLRVSERAPVTE